VEDVLGLDAEELVALASRVGVPGDTEHVPVKLLGRLEGSAW
jgi:hypothetical protein